MSAVDSGPAHEQLTALDRMRLASGGYLGPRGSRQSPSYVFLKAIFKIMPQVCHVTAIAAAPATVWSVTIDVEHWPQWLPTMERVTRCESGAFQRGARAQIKQVGLPLATWEVIEFEAGRAFAWETQVRGLRMIGRHEIIPGETASTCENRLTLEVRGWLGWLLWPLIAPAISRALTLENASLKQHCEAALGRSG